MAINLDKMKAKLDTLNSKGGGKNNFWRPQDGKQTIRILPTEDGDPFKAYHLPKTSLLVKDSSLPSSSEVRKQKVLKFGVTARRCMKHCCN